MKISFVAIICVVLGFVAGIIYERVHPQQRYAIAIAINGIGSLDSWTGKIAVWTSEGKNFYLPEPQETEE